MAQRNSNFIGAANGAGGAPAAPLRPRVENGTFYHPETGVALPANRSSAEWQGLEGAEAPSGKENRPSASYRVADTDAPLSSYVEEAEPNRIERLKAAGAPRRVVAAAGGNVTGVAGQATTENKERGMATKAINARVKAARQAVFGTTDENKYVSDVSTASTTEALDRLMKVHAAINEHFADMPNRVSDEINWHKDEAGKYNHPGAKSLHLGVAQKLIAGMQNSLSDRRDVTLGKKEAVDESGTLVKVDKKRRKDAGIDKSHNYLVEADGIIPGIKASLAAGKTANANRGILKLRGALKTSMAKIGSSDLGRMGILPKISDKDLKDALSAPIGLEQESNTSDNIDWSKNQATYPVGGNEDVRSKPGHIAVQVYGGKYKMVPIHPDSLNSLTTVTAKKQMQAAIKDYKKNVASQERAPKDVQLSDADKDAGINPNDMRNIMSGGEDVRRYSLGNKNAEAATRAAYGDRKRFKKGGWNATDTDENNLARHLHNIDPNTLSQIAPDSQSANVNAAVARVGADTVRGMVNRYRLRQGSSRPAIFDDPTMGEGRFGEPTPAPEGFRDVSDADRLHGAVIQKALMRRQIIKDNRTGDLIDASRNSLVAQAINHFGQDKVKEMHKEWGTEGRSRYLESILPTQKSTVADSELAARRATDAEALASTRDAAESERQKVAATIPAVKSYDPRTGSDVSLPGGDHHVLEIEGHGSLPVASEEDAHGIAAHDFATTGVKRNYTVSHRVLLPAPDLAAEVAKAKAATPDANYPMYNRLIGGKYSMSNMYTKSYSTDKPGVEVR